MCLHTALQQRFRLRRRSVELLHEAVKVVPSRRQLALAIAVVRQKLPAFAMRVQSPYQLGGEKELHLTGTVGSHVPNRSIGPSALDQRIELQQLFCKNAWNDG